MDQTFDRLFFGEHAAVGGVDEVGVTALAGPIVAACVVLPIINREDNLDLFLVDDSKKIREKYRFKNARVVQERALAYGIGVVSPMEIDATNIYVASNLAMKRAVEDCRKRFGKNSVTFLLLDGDRPIDIDIPHKLIIKGDMKSLCVASASIIAKVHRDSLMCEYHKLKPEYDFKSNKGYKCEAHFSGLDALGLWVGIHRATLHPLAKKQYESKEVRQRRKLWVEQTERALHLGDRATGLE